MTYVDEARFASGYELDEMGIRLADRNVAGIEHHVHKCISLRLDGLTCIGWWLVVAVENHRDISRCTVSRTEQ